MTLRCALYRLPSRCAGGLAAAAVGLAGAAGASARQDGGSARAAGSVAAPAGGLAGEDGGTARAAGATAAAAKPPAEPAGEMARQDGATAARANPPAARANPPAERADAPAERATRSLKTESQLPGACHGAGKALGLSLRRRHRPPHRRRQRLVRVAPVELKSAPPSPQAAPGRRSWGTQTVAVPVQEAPCGSVAVKVRW